MKMPFMPEDHPKFDSVFGAVSTALHKHMAEKRNDITEEVLAKCVTQALLCGDLRLNIAYGPNMTEGQSATYIPARRVAGLEYQLAEASRSPTPSEVTDWIMRNDWQGSPTAAKTAIEDARTLHNAYTPTPAIKCEHEWENSPTAGTPTRTKCRLCQQTCPY